ncbi:hypothetical protein ATANTOWER_029295 [Ataeniobius toweri]|uniref:Uncharacterized protein n=1 Tax=Ataeniobius toweri TaxID=208326 RepID=A0ABU7CC48_9TELE|nr:hypothetical protein [Ataeniobius toweri]
MTNCVQLQGQINKYMTNQCRSISWNCGTENIAPRRLKKRLCVAVNQRDDGELTSEVQRPLISERSLFIYPFALTVEKIRVKELGPKKLDIIIKLQTKEKNKVYNRSFCKSWFDCKSWLTSCRRHLLY